MKTEQRFDSIGRLIRPRPHDEKVFAKDWQREILLGYFEKDPYPAREVLQELEKKFSQTGAYKNLKKMLQQKNDVIKDLRIKLQKYDEQNMDHHSESE